MSKAAAVQSRERIVVGYGAIASHWRKGGVGLQRGDKSRRRLQGPTLRKTPLGFPWLQKPVRACPGRIRPSDCRT